MKVNQRQGEEAESPLISVKNVTSRYRQQKKKHQPQQEQQQEQHALKEEISTPALKESLEVAIAQSMSERPDEIFDMNERYQDYEDNLDTLEEERDDYYEEGDEEHYQERQGLQGKGRKEEGYISDIIQTFRLKEVIQRLQGYEDPNSTGVDDKISEIEDAHASELRSLEERLESEEFKSQDLLAELSKERESHKSEKAELESKISALEVKVALQERTYTGRLDAEKRKMQALKVHLEEVESRQNPPCDCKSSSRTSSKDLMQQVLLLQKEVTSLKNNRAAIEAALEARETTYEFYMTAAKNKIKELERCRDEVTTEQVESAHMDNAMAKTEALWELDRKQLKTLKLSESKAKMLLATERKKSKALETLVDKMRVAMNRSNKKVALLHRAEQKINILSRELKKKDAMLMAVKSLVENAEEYPLGPEGTWSRPILVDGESLTTVGVALDADDVSKMNGMLAPKETSSTIEDSASSWDC